MAGNKLGIERYSANWEKLSKKLRLIYPCAICGETDYLKKECHHIDRNKRNSTLGNALVLCLNCHPLIDDGLIPLPDPLPNYSHNSFEFKVAITANDHKDWFDISQPIRIIQNLPAKIANPFRHSNIKGFVKTDGCNYYIGMVNCNYLIGVLGFTNPEHDGKFDVLLKADTTPPEWEYSTDLLLYVLRTKQVQQALEKKFNRRIGSAYSMCFSQHAQINRYRKHAELIKKVKTQGGHNLGYRFELGNIPSLKAAKSMWMQKHKIQ
jgi:hypothetical protein